MKDYYLGENTKKHITFSVPVEKEVTRIDKNGEKITNIISCRLEFIESARFMASFYQILLIILMNESIKSMHKLSHFLSWIHKSKVDLIECKYLCSNKNY